MDDTEMHKLAQTAQTAQTTQTTQTFNYLKMFFSTFSFILQDGFFFAQTAQTFISSKIWDIFGPYKTSTNCTNF